MHQWGDETFDWDALDGAIRLMHSLMRRWGKIGVHSKEKFGTARLYVTFFDGSLHSLLYPGYVSSQFPQWLWHLDLMYISKFNNKVGVTKLVNWWQKKVYSYAYSRAIKQFPTVKVEIVCAADFPKLIKEHDSIMQKYSMMRTIRRILIEESNDSEGSLL